MRILVTNDDGVHASGLLPLIRWCMNLGEVTTVVPYVEQSGKSHGIELKHPFRVHEMTLAEDVSVWAIESTPADCVRFAVLAKKLEFDLVISGINRGYNIGIDSLYSGTVAAVREAALLGIPAIALSTSVPYYETAPSHLDMVWNYIQEKNLLNIHGLYNINIPPEPKGFLITRQGGPYYSDDFLLSDDGLCTPNGVCVYQNSNDLTLDTDAVTSGYISVLPQTVDMTNMEIFRKLV
jgi:5'-nucleotidase